MKHLRITVSGKAYDVIVEQLDSTKPANPITSVPVVQAAAPVAVAKPVAPPAPAPVAAGAGDTTSPLAGIVQSIAAEVGAVVSEGDTVVTLEAMKMFTSINASTGGTIKAIYVKVGDAVEEGQALYSIG